MPNDIKGFIASWMLVQHPAQLHGIEHGVIAADEDSGPIIIDLQGSGLHSLGRMPLEQAR